MVFFRNISNIRGAICEILVAIVFGLENPSFLAKSHIFIPKSTEGRGSTDLGIIPKNTIFLLLSLDITQVMRYSRKLKF